MDVLGDEEGNFESFDDEEVEKLLAMSERPSEDDLELRNTIVFSEEDEENNVQVSQNIACPQTPKPRMGFKKKNKRAQKKVAWGFISSRKLYIISHSFSK